MDLPSVTSIKSGGDRATLSDFGEGDAWLAGGTWLYSEPQPQVKRLIDLDGFAWEPLTATRAGLSIAATCTVATLDAFEPPAEWNAATLIGPCCRAFLASFKIWNMATVGGNLCAALPPGPMISLTAALDGVCVIWTPDGGERRVSVFDFVKAPQTTHLRRGEVLRAVELPQVTLTRRAAFRRASLTALGRSGVLLIATIDSAGDFSLTVTAATRRPIRLAWETPPSAAALRERLASEIPEALYFDDIHGRPDWRRHMTHVFAEEIRQELAEGRS
jgi:CO/xanthine dehydrogenase FAD-binding subunit